MLFILFYFIKLYHFDDYKELMTGGQIFSIISGIVLGIIILVFLSFLYFSGLQKY